jgi:Ser/Thr protein kinase RdoA (MazF antagonist)
MSWTDQVSCCACWPGVRRRAVKAEPALTPGRGGAQRSRLDQIRLNSATWREVLRNSAALISASAASSNVRPVAYRHMRGTIDLRRGGWVRRRTLRRVRWRAIAMTGIEASTSPPALPRWFGPRASPDDPAVSALIDRVARGAGWADIGGGFNLNLRIDAEPPVVLRVHRPWVRRGRVAGLRRLRERLQRTQVRVARPIPISGCDLLRVADRWAELEEFIDHVQPRADEDSYVRVFEELGRVHTALKAVWEPSPPEPLDDHRTFGQLRYSVGFTRRRLGPRSEPVVHRMRQLTGELSKLRKEVELPCAPIHGDYKLGNAGELSDGSWATFDLDFARVRERLYDIAGSLNHVAQSGALLEPRRLLDAYEGTAPEPLTPDEHRWLPGALALIPLHWAATAGLVGDGIREAESAMTAAEAWWSRRAELSS